MENVFKKIISVGLILCLLFTAAFTISQNTFTANAATGSLISKNGVWYGGAEDGASTTVNWGGYYKIMVNSEGKGIVCTAYLAEGTVLRFDILQGASFYICGTSGKNDRHWSEKIHSLNAALLYANGVPLVGAGGGSSDCVIDNSKFSASDCRGYATNRGEKYKFLAKAETIQGSTSASDLATTVVFGTGIYDNCYTGDGATKVSNKGSITNISGANYLDISRATLVSQDADSFSMENRYFTNIASLGNRTCSFRVEAIPNSQDDSYDAQISMANSLKQLVSTNKQIAEAIKDSSAGGNDMYPSVTVCENQNFDVVVAAYDDMQGGTSLNGECTVVNSAIGDGIVQLQGKFMTKGTYSVLINGNKFIVKVIEAPKPNTVKVILN